jgi:type II secretory pathway component PulC
LVNVEQQAKEPWGADPFRVKARSGKKNGKARKKPRWQLSGILYNNQHPVAIINKRQVRTGETINDAKVLKIDKKAVTLEHNGKQMTLTVTKG